VTADPVSRISFAPDQVTATRAPAHAECQEKNAAFTDDDEFTLAATKNPPDNATVQSVFILFRRTVSVGTPVHLLLGPPSERHPIGDDALQAHAPDARTGPDVSVIHPGWSKGTPPSNSLADATVTLLQLASTDGQPIKARVELRFHDDSVLDATFSAPLESYAGPCGGQ
jgi:hypothetical protein